jgi:hypothetical protein
MVNDIKLRESKDSDQEKATEAYEALMKLIEGNQGNIESALWVGPMIGALADVFERTNIPFQLFKKELNQCIDHYKY